MLQLSMFSLCSSKGVDEESLSDDNESFCSMNDETKMSVENSCAAKNESVSNSKEGGSRKRKLNNPVRLSAAVYPDSNDEFCCYDDGTEISREEEEQPGDEENRGQEEDSSVSEEPAKKIKPSPKSSDDEDDDENDRILAGKQNPQNHEKDLAPLNFALGANTNQSSSPKDQPNGHNNSEKDTKNKETSDDIDGDGGNLEKCEQVSNSTEDASHINRLESLPIFKSGSSDSGKSDDEENNNGNCIGGNWDVYHYCRSNENSIHFAKYY